jgi:hypothetical protein
MHEAYLRCKGRNGRNIIRFLDKGDANSTSNLLRHAKICWGTEEVEAATAMRDLDAARDVLSKTKLWDGMILAEFQRIFKDKVTYRHTQHTTTEVKYILFLILFFFFIRILESRSYAGLLKVNGPSKLSKTVHFSPL